MLPAGRMRHLTTVQGSFHGRIIAARLGAEGIAVDLRGLSEGPYPLPTSVEVYVRAEQLDLAREILLADAIDAAIDADEIEAAVEAEKAHRAPVDDGGAGEPAGHPNRTKRAILVLVTAAVLIALVVAVITAA